jgi:diguanylate cyclase (GGDEF)-like protein
MWTMLALAAGWTGMSIGGDLGHNLTTAFLGIALISLMPVTVASITLTRNELTRRLERAATRDFLTDALNRSAFTTAGQNLLARHDDVSALMLDLDRFKRINDTYGHAAGDRVLQAFARVVEHGLRADDLFGRIGGEEFAVLLPCAADEAAEVAERVRTAFAEERVTIESGEVLQATVSIGLAAGGADLDALLARADEALYRAKADGRNRLALAA